MRGKKHIIKQIKRPDGSVVTDVTDILLTWTEYYAKLYKAQILDPSVQDSFLDKFERRLSPVQAQRCEGFLTADECFVA